MSALVIVGTACGACSAACGDDGVAKVTEIAADAANKTKAAVSSNPWLWAHALAAAIVVLVLWRKGLFRPGGLSRGRKVGDHPWYLWFACGAMVWLSFSLAIGAAAGVSGVPLDKTPGSLKSQAILLLAGYGASIAVGLVLVRLVRAASPEAGMSGSRRSLGLGVLAFLAAWPIVTVVSVAAAWVHGRITGAAPDEIAHETLKSLADNPNNPWAWTLAGLAVIAAPVQEEIIYRAFGQSALLAATGRPWVAVLGTSAIFAGVHMAGAQPVPWYAAVAIFCLAVCMGVAFERAKSLLVPIVMHVLFNAANVAMVVFS